MNLTASARTEWLQWVRVTSVPLIHLGEGDSVLGLGSGMMLDHAGCRFLLAVEHVVRQDATGWAVAIQQDGRGRMEYYRPNFFTYVGEIRRVPVKFACSTCAPPTYQQTWRLGNEYRTPNGLFDKLPHHVFDRASLSTPTLEQIYGFSGQVRTEKHGTDAFMSDMVVYPGLKYSHTEQEVHHFTLPVAHPGHDAFHGCSGSPIVDVNHNVVGLVVGGNIPSNSIQGVAIERVLPNLEFLASRSVA